MTTPADVRDLGGAMELLSKRIFTLEQRITSPEFVVPNGSSPTFSSVKIGVVGNPDVTLVPTQDAPTNLVTTPLVQGSEVRAQVTWNAAVNAVQYEVSWYLKALNTNDWTLVGTDRTVGTTFTTPPLLPNRTYGFRVWAVNGLGRLSDPAPSGTTYAQVVTGQDSTIPVLLTGLISVAGATSLTLMWDESTDPDVRNDGLYEVEIDNNSDFSSPLYSQQTAASIVSFTGLTVGTTYYSRVRGIDGSGNVGGWSEFTARTITGATPAPGSIDDSHIVTAGLSAATIKFGTMNGARIETKTLDANAIMTSTLTATTITLGTGGSIIGGATPQGPTSTGFSLSELGLRLTKAGANTVVLDAQTGDVTITGTINATAGSFTGNITSSAVITGGSFVGATFTTTVASDRDRAIISDDGINIQREGTVNALRSPGYWTYTHWSTSPALTVGGAIVSGWKLEAYQATRDDLELVGLLYNGLTYKAHIIRSTSAVGASFYQDYTSQTGAVTPAAGQTWTFSGHFATTSALSGSDVPRVYIQFYNASNAILSTTYSPQDPIAIFTWYRLKVTATAPAGTTRIRVGYTFPAGTTAITHVIMAWQLENKDRATSWAGPAQLNAVPLSTATNDSGWSRSTFDIFSARSGSKPNTYWGNVYGTMQAGQWRDNGLTRYEAGTIVFEAPRSAATTVPADTHTGRIWSSMVFASPAYIGEMGMTVGDYYAGTGNTYASVGVWRGYGVNIYHGKPVGGSVTDNVVRIGQGESNYVGMLQHTANSVTPNGNFHIDALHNHVYIGWIASGSVAGLKVGNGARTWGYVDAAGFTTMSKESSKRNIEDLRTVYAPKQNTPGAPVSGVLSRIKGMRPVRFEDPPTNSRSRGPRLSIVAESVLASFPEAAVLHAVDEEIPYDVPEQVKAGDLFGIDLAGIIAINTSAIQELLARLEVLETKVGALSPRP